MEIGKGVGKSIKEIYKIFYNDMQEDIRTKKINDDVHKFVVQLLWRRTYIDNDFNEI